MFNTKNLLNAATGKETNPVYLPQHSQEGVKISLSQSNESSTFHYFSASDSCLLCIM
jgi:hypothetical protein